MEENVKCNSYFEGILHTYAALNQPNSTLWYEYEVCAFEKTENIAASLKENFTEFSQQRNITLKRINLYDLELYVKQWFFQNGEIHKLNINTDRQAWEASNFCNSIAVALELSEFYYVDNLTFEYELGILYDYFVLIGATKNYLLYFRYSD
ncbi:hypothetical protein AAEO56_18525 [Flavobacterium sp. DGU11]|uniref:Immunity protein 22 n=1 Tax=Flavobacterium arundinis TaxID=3139143 RepID=A0ABU9I1H0_9FLAO